MKKDERGFILISTYLVIAVLSVLALAMYFRNQTSTVTSERNLNRMRSFQYAESGLDLAMGALESDTTYSGAAFATLGAYGGYDVEVCPGTCNGLTEPSDSSIRILQVTGYSPSDDATDMNYEARAITAYVALDSTPFQYAIHGQTSVTLNGNPTVDSYDSSAGAYSSSSAGSEGSVATNGTISLVGNAAVSGTLYEDVNLDCSAASTDESSSGSLSISGNTNYSLSAGIHRFSSISITGNGTLTPDGAVTIYVDGTVSIAGNGVSTYGDDPTNFIILMTDDDAVSISGNGDFYGGIYAPESSVSNTGNGDIHGAVISDTYQQSGNGDLHFDTEMADVEAPCSSVELRSWTENNTVAGG